MVRLIVIVLVVEIVARIVVVVASSCWRSVLIVIWMLASLGELAVVLCGVVLCGVVRKETTKVCPLISSTYLYNNLIGEELPLNKKEWGAIDNTWVTDLKWGAGQRLIIKLRPAPAAALLKAVKSAVHGSKPRTFMEIVEAPVRFSSMARIFCCQVWRTLERRSI